MRRSTTIVLLGALLALAARAQDAPAPSAPAVAAVPDLARLWWMAGTWQGELLGGTFEEHWMRPRGGLVLGCGRAIRDGKAVFHEYLRIEARDNTLVYTVQPMGREGVQFRLESFEQDDAARTARYTFRNPDHARQHTIEYRWAGDAVAGRIAGERDGQPWEQAFTFSRAPDGRPAAKESGLGR